MRPYQQEAVQAITTGLTRGPWGQLHAACGSGKTFMAQRVMEELLPGPGLIVFLAPSLALVGQTLRAWQAGSTAGFRAMAVCSDEKLKDAPVRTADLPVPVSTDPEVIASWLGHGGRQVIVGTYKSAERVGEGMRQAGIQADLLLCDEGHHLFGTREAVRRRIVIDADFLTHRRRLLMTATPDVTGLRADALSWRDEKTFGPVLYRYPFTRGIAEGYLKDYRLLVLGIGSADARALLADTASNAESEVALRTAAAQAALAHSRVTYGSQRVITFHARVQQAVDFARTLPATIARLPVSKQPAGPVDATYISGAMNSDEREAIMARLAQPPTGGWTVVSNAQCLVEGVDTPEVDTIVFTHPSRSAVRVTQAVGRALRRNDTTVDTATIIVPIILPDETTEVGDLDTGDFEVLFEVVRALRAHDDSLAAELDHERWSLPLRAAAGRGPGQSGVAAEAVPEVPERIVYQLPPGTSDRILNQLRLLTVRNSTSSWWEGYANAVAFHREHGHLNASSRTLISWLSDCRKQRHKGWLPQDRIDALDRIGMVWDPLNERRQQLLRDARAYYAANGNLAFSNSYVTPEGRRLGKHFYNLRVSYHKGSVPQYLIDALNEMGMSWSLQAPWKQELLAACDRYLQRFNNLEVPNKFVDDTGYRLGKNLSSLRSAANGADRRRTLDPDLRAELEKRGFRFEPRYTAMTEDQKKALLEKVQAGAHLRDASAALDLTGSIVAAARKRTSNSTLS
ncbi:DEAD/DEAH box helicase [Streptomyces rhizosphaericus]|uniref:DEAD/DEAH box helicase n=1 Tax=Streptomyces rhizosphaericus TaxID=114699 RepID=UPI003645C3C9